VGAISAVLFDFDGTLGTYRPSHLELYVQAAAEFGIVVTAEAVRAQVEAAWGSGAGMGFEHRRHSRNERAYARFRAQLHRRRLEAAGASGNLDALDAAALRIVELEADPAHFALYPDTLPGLERLRAAGVTAYVVSNHVWRLPAVVAALGLGPYVNAVITSARLGYRKPHPRVYEAAIAAAGGAPEALLFIGDSYAHDVEGPRAAGLRALRIDRSGGARGPDVIGSLLEIPL
jgi:putative hydrolase of the HAD superfamily